MTKWIVPIYSQALGQPKIKRSMIRCEAPDEWDAQKTATDTMALSNGGQENPTLYGLGLSRLVAAHAIDMNQTKCAWDCCTLREGSAWAAKQFDVGVRA